MAVKYSTFKFSVDADGIALAALDVPGRSMNTLTAAALADLAAITERVRTDGTIRGLIITSGKPGGFCAGADIGEIEVPAPRDAETPEEAVLQQRFEKAFAFNRVLRALETCGKPVAAAINGLALAAGLELALACHHRVCGDHPRLQLGLPEARIGLLPGAGGTQRLPRLIGAAVALPLILDGQTLTPQEALRAGIVHTVVAAGAEIGAAREWLRTKGDPVQPWDRRDYRMPGGTPYSPGAGQVFVLGNALMRKQTHGNYPAQHAILKCVYEGIQVPFDAGLRIESRYLAAILGHPTARNMMRSVFLSPRALSKGARRPKDQPRAELKRVAVLGAGLMGSAIASLQAMAGLETILLDTTLHAAERGKSFTANQLSRQVERGLISRAKADATRDLIATTVDYGDIADADFVIEAVYEKAEIKAGVLREAEAVVGADIVIASNSSGLSISALAEASRRPANYIGIHFLAPADTTGVVEIVVGRQSSPRALAVAMDYARLLRKTPIVVNDSPGFFMARCFATYVDEGEEMVAEGIAPAIVENVGRMTGMPRGPLEAADDMSLDAACKSREAARQGGMATASDRLIEAMVFKQGRYGRKNGKGFYDYPVEGPKRLWPGLADIVDVRVGEVTFAEIEALKTRLLYRQAIEAARCYAEGVVSDPREVDVGAIQGWGFASWTGGPLRLIDTVGVAAFVAEADRLAERHGSRFAPPSLLREMAAEGRSFYVRRRGQAGDAA